jgi:transposase
MRGFDSRQYNNRDDAIPATHATGAYSYQQIAKEFRLHFATMARIVREPDASSELRLRMKVRKPLFMS